jgi:hypothetical protein
VVNIHDRDVRDGRPRDAQSDANRDKLAARAAKIKAERQARADEKPAPWYPLENIGKWAAANRNRLVLLEAIEPPKIPKDLAGAAKAADLKHAELTAAIRAIEVANLPFADVYARGCKFIDDMAKPWDLRPATRMHKPLSGRSRPGSIRLPEQLRPGTASEFEPDPVAMLFFFCGDIMKARLESDLKSLALAKGMPAAERPGDVPTAVELGKEALPASSH